MSARAVISTDAIDRVGDQLIPRGCRLENYAKNPVVLWAHGLEGIAQPIGTSLSPEGKLAVSVTDDQVQATSWFSQKSLEAAQIFELIDEGIVRATSVRETPLRSRIRAAPDGRDVLVVEEWELEEWSWCAIGVNPDAVAKTLNRNRLGGQPITPSVLKSLIAVAPPVKKFGIGFSTEKCMTVPLELEKVSEELVENSSSELDDIEELDETQPYGSSVVAAAYASIAGVCQSIEDAMLPLENPAVKEGLSAILVNLQEQATALEGLHASSYPDQPSLKCERDEGSDLESLKAFLAAGRVPFLQVIGLGTRLKGLIGAKNLTPHQRRTLTGVAKQMSRLVSQSKAHHTEGDNARLAALQSSIDELTRLCGGIK
ncbi:hypothetical protein [Schlesneria sp. T3-172]|uniref:hypothetical protein n=1 Tax=Schlesneria sphaerica TaxID=3373610 RepID=UPI0037C82267